VAHGGKALPASSSSPPLAPAPPMSPPWAAAMAHLSCRTLDLALSFGEERDSKVDTGNGGESMRSSAPSPNSAAAFASLLSSPKEGGNTQRSVSFSGLAEEEEEGGGGRLSESEGLHQPRQKGRGKLLPSPFMLPGGFHATCLHLGAPSSLGKGEQALHRLPPAFAIFRIRRPLALADLNSGGEVGNHAHPTPPPPGDLGSCGGGADGGLVVCFGSGSGCGGAEGNPDWLNALFEGKDQVSTFESECQALFEHQDLDEEEEEAVATSLALTVAAKELTGVKLHRGWLQNLLAVLPTLLPALAAQLKLASRADPLGSTRVWCAGHGVGGAYAQLLQLVLLGARYGQGALSTSQEGTTLGGAVSRAPRLQGAVGKSPSPGKAAASRAHGQIQGQVSCVVFGSPQVVASDPCGRVRALLLDGSGGSRLQCFVFGHDLVPRVLASPPKNPVLLSSHEQVQLRRIEHYCPRFRELIEVDGQRYLPLGDYFFLHPCLGYLSTQPLSVHEASPGSAEGDQPQGAHPQGAQLQGAQPQGQRGVLLRRLDMSWAVLPIAWQLHDPSSAYADGTRLSAGLSPPGTLPPPASSASTSPQQQKHLAAAVERKRSDSKHAEGPSKASSFTSSPAAAASAKRQTAATAKRVGWSSHEEAMSAAGGDFLPPRSGREEEEEEEEEEEKEGLSGGAGRRGQEQRKEDGDGDGEEATKRSLGVSVNHLLEFLTTAKLSHHELNLRAEGYEEVDDLDDAEDSDLLKCGLKKPEIRRLRRYLDEG